MTSSIMVYHHGLSHVAIDGILMMSISSLENSRDSVMTHIMRSSVILIYWYHRKHPIGIFLRTE